MMDRDTRGLLLAFASCALTACAAGPSHRCHISPQPTEAPARWSAATVDAYGLRRELRLGDSVVEFRLCASGPHTFWLSTHECTVRLWNTVMGCDAPGAPDLPVRNLSLADCMRFFERLESRVPGTRARLPTDEEWSSACLAGASTSFPWGDRAEDRQACYDWVAVQPEPVGSYPPNAWGLHDMIGNVREWCTVADVAGAPRATLRGGCWEDPPADCRWPARASAWAGIRSPTSGFRICVPRMPPD